MKRRNFIKFAVAGSLAARVSLNPIWAATEPDLELELSAAPDSIPILNGEATSVLRFTGRVLKGRKNALRSLASYLGPILDLRRGERVRIHFLNGLNESSIVHWHGLIVPDLADGHPRFAVPAGGRYTYEFTVVNPAGTYLYHPHPHGRTGPQVYAGLVGMLIVRDSEEAAIGLPAGPHELPLIIQDRIIDGDNQFVYSNAMMNRMSGVLGDTILVNGQADAEFRVSRGSYRLRVMNASNARIYKLAWSDGHPLTIIGTDNGLLSNADGPVQRPYIMLGPTERVEILEDFGKRSQGIEIALLSRQFEPGTEMQMGMGGNMMQGMMGNGMMGDGMMRSSQGREMLIARFVIAREKSKPGKDPILPGDVPPAGEPRQELTTQIGFRHMEGFLNGRSFEMTAVTRDERLSLDTPVLWTFEHEPGMGMHMPHPMHIHGVRFRILKREILTKDASEVTDGFVDNGYKDTLLIFPGQRVQVLLAASQPGLFMYHCHNLEHEDGGMMRNFLVET